MPDNGAAAKHFDVSVIRQIQEHIARHGECELLPGLTPSELASLEAKYQFRFPLDLAAFLSAGVPVDPPAPVAEGQTAVPAAERANPSGWHNWHWLLKVTRQPWCSPDDDLDPSDTITCQLRWHAPPDPDDSDDEWQFAEGENIEYVADSEQRVWKDRMRREALERHPLIPLLGHRMMPTVRYGADVPVAHFPVFSMHGNDCIVYANSLWGWLCLEFPRLQLETIVPAHWQLQLRAAEPALCERPPFLPFHQM
jgi:hypothetical protein